MQKSVGLIGLGNIGSYFTQQLLNAGYPLTVLDIDSARLKQAEDLGAHTAQTPGELAEKSDVIVLALPSSKQVAEVMDGNAGILAHIRPGHLIIDTGTTQPAVDIRYQALAAQKGAGFLDAPITWRREGLIIMVGGSDENFAAGQDVIDCLSYKFKHIGEIGQGQSLKLLNQMIQAGQLAVWSEAIEMGRMSGVDPRLLKDFLEFPINDDLFGNDFTGGGHLSLHYKDLGYALELAHDTGAQIPMTSLVHEIFKATKPFGHPNWKQPGIVTFWRRLNRTE
jgi:3-hydroxyisobutyrate dehydrogenase-like beta-hydroxyacid dehydrogenase